MSARPIVPEPPKRGRGRPRRHGEPLVGLRIRLPESLHAEVKSTAAAIAGWSLNDEIIRRCRAAGPPPT